MRPFSTDTPDCISDLPAVAVMDGSCALCSFGARMIHRLDRTGDVRILPIQSDRGRAVLHHFGLAEADPETWLFISDGRAWRDFDAMIELGGRMGGWGYILTPLRIMPRPARNWLYRLVARNRYALFGRADLCGIPDPGLRARLVS